MTYRYVIKNSTLNILFGQYQHKSSEQIEMPHPSDDTPVRVSTVYLLQVRTGRTCQLEITFIEGTNINLTTDNHNKATFKIKLFK